MPDLNHTYTFSAVQIGAVLAVALFIMVRVIYNMRRAHAKMTQANRLLQESQRVFNDIDDLRDPIRALSQSFAEALGDLEDDIDEDDVSRLDRDVQESLGLISYEEARSLDREQEERVKARDSVHMVHLWAQDAEEEVRQIGRVLEEKRRAIYQS